MYNSNNTRNKENKMTLVLLQAALHKNEEMLRNVKTLTNSIDLMAQRCTIYKLMNELLLEQVAQKKVA